MFHTSYSKLDISYLKDLSPEILEGGKKESYLKIETKKAKEIQIEWSSSPVESPIYYGKNFHNDLTKRINKISLG
jgi:hypothetical protein